MLISFLLYHYYYGITHQRTVNIIAFDPKFGYRAIDKSKRIGDDLLPVVEKTLMRNYQHTSISNLIIIYEVILANESEKSVNLSWRLYTSHIYKCKILGASLLLGKGIYPKNIKSEDIILKVLYDKKLNSQYKEAKRHENLKELIIIGMGDSKKDEYVKYLLKALQKENNYQEEAAICTALLKIGDCESVSKLVEQLGDDDFYALPEALKTIICLGGDHTKAIYTLILRIEESMKGYRSGRVIDDLEFITNKEYGYNKDQWLEWFMNNKDEIKLYNTREYCTNIDL